MKKMRTAVTLLIIFLMVTALYICGRYEKSPDGIFTGKINDTKGEWTVVTSDGITKAEASFSLLDRGEHEEWMLFFRSHWKNYYIRVGNKTVYHKNSKRDGPVHLFDIPSGDSLTISFIGATKENMNDVKKSSIMIGNKNDMYRLILKDNLYAVFIGVLSLILGGMCMFASFYTKLEKTKKIHSALWNLGLYILIEGIWVVTDSHILLLVTQHTGIVELISFLAIFTLPIPLLGFISVIMPNKTKMLSVIRKIFVFNLTFYIINYIIGWFTIIVILICEHLFMTVTLVFMIWNGINENKKHKDLKLQRVIDGCTAYCVCSIIALTLFYYGDMTSYSHVYSIGIVVFVAFLINAACIVMYEQVQEKANIDIYARMAYMDTMTGLGNRTAFLEENKSNAIFPGMISYIMMDANNLKTINDTLGHNKGDELIITIAKCMRKAVGHNGQCYRIGGDEFVIILKNKTAAETEKIINKVRCEIEFADKQSDITISVAIGYVWIDTEQKNLEDLMQHADDEMYKDKKKTKENKSKENTHSI